MEAFKNYVDFNDLVSSVTRIANNLDKMMEIMTTTSIKLDPEKARSVLNEWYGNMVMDEVSKKFWSANEIGKKDEEIQDLKMENDRLKQREEIIIPFINSLACNYTSLDCDDCIYHSINGCKFSDLYSGSPICKEAESILKKLEDL